MIGRSSIPHPGGKTIDTPPKQDIYCKEFSRVDIFLVLLDKQSKSIMSWQNFGTSVAAAAVGIGTWLLTTNVIGEMPTTQPVVAAVIRILISLLFVGLFVYVIDKVVPQFFCPAQVAVPQEPPTQSGPAPPPAAAASATPPAPPTGVTAAAK